MSATQLRQFICKTCPGKFAWHEFRLWYERVPIDGTSRCYVCNQQKQPVPTGEELYVHICHFSCSIGHALRMYTVRCKMSDTAPCYATDCCRQVSPHSFSPLRRINKQSDNVHNCSECNGCLGCPNMKTQRDEMGGGVVTSLKVVKGGASSQCG